MNFQWSIRFNYSSKDPINNTTIFIFDYPIHIEHQCLSILGLPYDLTGLKDEFIMIYSYDNNKCTVIQRLYEIDPNQISIFVLNY